MFKTLFEIRIGRLAFRIAKSRQWLAFRLWVHPKQIPSKHEALI